RHGGSTRDAAAKHKARADRDGDLMMGAAPRTDRIGKGASRRGGHASRGPGRTLNPDRLHKEVLKHVNGPSTNGKASENVTAPRMKREFTVTGWKGCKASKNEDKGVGSLIAFMEKKATMHLSKRSGDRYDPVRIKKFKVQDDDTLLITVQNHEAGSILQQNGYLFAGKNIKVTEITDEEQKPASSEERLNEVERMFQRMLARRYNPETKLLDLSNLGQDPDLVAAGMFDLNSTTSKFFPALMKTCDVLFKTSTEKKEKFESISLANNGLDSIKPVTTLASTFPDVKNLDLSNNNLANLDAFSGWERKFRNLDYLVVTGNPLEQSVPDFHLELMKWYRKMRILNGQQVRTDEEAALKKKSGVPVRGPNFQDEAGIGQTFVTNFIAGFDSDRAALANIYYDETSTFSLSVNTHAMRDPSAPKLQTKEWESYIRKSRNLKVISGINARIDRLFTGKDAIAEAFATIPVTKHASLETEPAKWSIDCVLLPSVPDPTGQYPQGVQGLLVTLHGEFSEMDVSTGQPTKLRSFDRTFTLGPGGQTGVRVINDVMTLRGYGGFEAWQPEDVPAAVAPPQAQLTQDQIIMELCRLTNMKPEYSKMCLDESGWNPDLALTKFEGAKATLPPDAFI
ncbi:NTF2-like protein, partial [Saccharata proteae CBS 121410]